jgi:hypothetical protein
MDSEEDMQFFDHIMRRRENGNLEKRQCNVDGLQRDESTS